MKFLSKGGIPGAAQARNATTILLDSNEPDSASLLHGPSMLPLVLTSSTAMPSCITATISFVGFQALRSPACYVPSPKNDNHRVGLLEKHSFRFALARLFALVCACRKTRGPEPPRRVASRQHEYLLLVGGKQISQRAEMGIPWHPIQPEAGTFSCCSPRRWANSYCQSR